MELQHAFVQTNGIRMHYVTAGKGPLLILLHGFPQFWYSWRHQIPVLAEKFQVVAPDLRGYGDTDRPPHTADYRLSEVSKDIAGLIQALGHTKARIVGHDWGGATAWRLAMDQPQLVERLAILNSPHPRLFQKALRSNFTQMKKSWYIFFFQLPAFPELLFKMDPRGNLKKILRGMKRDTFSDKDLETYLQAIQKPGAFKAALNYYRAAFRSSLSERKMEKIAAPTLIIWGEEDKALGKELTEGMEPLFSAPFRIAYIPNCSHWVQEEEPETVNRLLLEFLS